MRWMMSVMMTLLAIPATSQAQVKYATQIVAGLPLAVPVGWTVSQSATPVPTIKLEARPGEKDSPSVLLMVVADNPANMAQRLVHGAMPAGARALNQQTDANGAVLSEWEGVITGIPARMAVIVRVAPQGGVVAAFAAPIGQYSTLGGPNLLLQVLSGQSQAAGKSQASRSTQAPPPTQGAVKLELPLAYASHKTPVLNWFADKFEMIPPAQVAAGLRRVNATEAQLLGTYSAFGNLVHYRACLADATSRLPSGATCAQTAAGWRQTLQFLNGNVAQAIQEATRQRGSLQVAARCTDGRNSASACTAFRQTIGDVNRMQNASMIRIINNLGGNTCVVGDANCVPY